MNLKTIFFLAFCLCALKPFAQHYCHYETSSGDHSRDVAELHFSFYTQEKKIFKAAVDVYALKGSDTLSFISDLSGQTKITIPPGEYSLLLCSELTDTLKIPSFTFQRYRSYYFDCYLFVKMIGLPEIRYDLGKPVIYCYNDNPQQEISLVVNCFGTLKFMYPEYKNEWIFTADSNGTVSSNGEEYPYLFWDAAYTNIPDYFAEGKGFTVPSEKLVPFFDSLLNALQFSARERTDFIVYWVPKMIAFEAVDLHFIVNSSCDELATLDIDPLPSELFRLYMIWRPSAGNENFSAQQLPAIDRQGFTVIEWGGMMVDQRISE